MHRRFGSETRWETCGAPNRRLSERHAGESRKSTQRSKFHAEALLWLSQGQSQTEGGPTAGQCLTALEVLLAGGSGREYERRCLTNPSSWPTGRSSRGIFYQIIEAASEPTPEMQATKPLNKNPLCYPFVVSCDEVSSLRPGAQDLQSYGLFTWESCTLYMLTDPGGSYLTLFWGYLVLGL